MSRKSGKTGKINDEQRAFLVEQIACFASPKEAADALYLEFGVEVTPQNVEKYDHTKQAGKRCAEKWRVLYVVTREAFRKHIADRVPHAEKAYRVRKLAKAADAFENAGKYVAMASMLEKVAKELGGAYTNRREHTGKDGGAIKIEDVSEMTTEMLESRIDALWAKALGRSQVTEVKAPTKPH